jgi:iron complex transport system substrate-binding protein
MYSKLKPIHKLLGILLSVICLNACNTSTNKQHNNPAKELNEVTLKHAKGFTLYQQEDFTLLKVRDPWQGARDIEFTYVLTHDPDKVPEAYGAYPVIKIPVSRVICMSTTHVGFLDKLHALNSVVGLSGKRFVTTPALKKRAEHGQVHEVGYESTMNYELMAGLSPDLVFTYGVGSNVASYNQKLNELGIPTVFVAEYLETTPLGRAEWILFLAAFYDKLPEAQAYFNQVDSAYTQLTRKSGQFSEKPKVLTGFPYKDTWYVPGGNSFIANLIRDAGGNFLWPENKERKSQALSVESVFERASDAEVWIHLGKANTKKQILQYDNRFRDFAPYNHARIYNNNAVQSSGGGSAFWERGASEPHVLMRELMQIFHPEAFSSSDSLFYYKPLR